MHLKTTNGEICTLNKNGRYVLLELPSQAVPTGIKQEIFYLKSVGITPIIAHPERNAVIKRNPHILSELIHMGALAQLTAMSVRGDFGPETGKAAKELLGRRLAQLIASDAHSARTRPPQLGEALDETARILGSTAEAEAMVSERPAAIVAGDIFDFPGHLNPDRGITAATDGDPWEGFGRPVSAPDKTVETNEIKASVVADAASVHLAMRWVCFRSFEDVFRA